MGYIHFRLILMTEILINVKEIRIITNNIAARIVYYIDEETDYR